MYPFDNSDTHTDHTLSCDLNYFVFALSYFAGFTRRYLKLQYSFMAIIRQNLCCCILLPNRSWVLFCNYWKSGVFFRVRQHRFFKAIKWWVYNTGTYHTNTGIFMSYCGIDDWQDATGSDFGDINGSWNTHKTK